MLTAGSGGGDVLSPILGVERRRVLAGMPSVTGKAKVPADRQRTIRARPPQPSGPGGGSGQTGLRQVEGPTTGVLSYRRRSRCPTCPRGAGVGTAPSSVHKIAGALAEQGADLEEPREPRRPTRGDQGGAWVSDRMSLDTCTVPAPPRRKGSKVGKRTLGPRDPTGEAGIEAGSTFHDGARCHGDGGSTGWGRRTSTTGRTRPLLNRGLGGAHTCWKMGCLAEGGEF